MPLTVWEAMANKLPAIAPDVGGFKEIIEENNCGLVYTPGDIKDAGEKLLKMIKDSSLRKDLGENGFNAFKTRYTSEKFKETIERVYTDLVA
jgi:glycosyltransferase involved in cell wall biosynthesis